MQRPWCSKEYQIILTMDGAGVLSTNTVLKCSTLLRHCFALCSVRVMIMWKSILAVRLEYWVRLENQSILRLGAGIMMLSGMVAVPSSIPGGRPKQADTFWHHSRAFSRKSPVVPRCLSLESNPPFWAFLARNYMVKLKDFCVSSVRGHQ